jgi:ankyrin repeat protein
MKRFLQQLTLALALGGAGGAWGATPPKAASKASIKAASQVEAARSALRTHRAADAASLLQSTAAGGDSEAQYLLGQLKLAGIGVATDTASAERWLRAAAEQNHPAASFVLAAVLQSEGNTDEAQRWLQRAAELGYPRAQAALKDGQPLFAPERDGDSAARADWALYCARHDDAAALNALGTPAIAAHDEFGRAALAQAADAGAVHAVTALLALGADARSVDRFQIGALMLAARQGNVGMMQALLTAGADANQVDVRHRSALFYAVRGGSLEAVQMLLAAGANVTATDERGYNALDVAQSVGAEHISALLREHGVHPTLSSVPVRDANAGHIDASRLGERYRGWSPVALAVNHRDLATAQALISAGADVNALTPEGDPLWRVAVDASAPELLKLLLASGARPATPDHQHHTALAYTVANGDATLLSILLGSNVNVQLHAAGEPPPLLAAAERGKSAAVSALLGAGAAVNEQDAAGHTALMLASQRGDEELARELLERGAGAELADKQGRTALWYAARAGAQSLVARLLTAKAAVDTADANGVSPLLAAVGAGHGAVMAQLLTAGAPTEGRDHEGNSALLLAAARGSSEMVSALLQHGAHPDVQNRGGDTALMAASRIGALAACNALLQAGANRSVRNSVHSTALDIARARGFSELAQLLDRRS